MSATLSSHPTPDDLAAFAVGKLADAQIVAVCAHLAECATCRAMVERASDDTFTGNVKAAGPTGTQVGLPSGTVPLPPTAGDTLPPELADHPRYRIVRKLGQGGMGVVYLAQHKVMDDPRAIKVIAQGLVDRPDAL